MVQQSTLDHTFAALADPVRRAVIERLVMGNASVSTLAADHPISLTAFLKHVHVLEDAGILTTEKTGRVRTCRLTAPPLIAAEGWLRGHRTFWEHQLAALARFVETPTPQESPAWRPKPRPHIRSKSAVRSTRPPNASTTRGRRRKP